MKGPMKFKLIILVFALVGIAFTGSAQFSFKQKYEAASALHDEKQYVYALEVWLQLDSMEPNNANINYKIGFCYLQMNEGKARSLPYLQKTLSSISKGYDPFSHTEKNAPMEAHFYLGRALHLNQQFDKAKEQFNLFKSTAHKKHYLLDEVPRQLSWCDNAKRETANPKEGLEITNVGSVINSAYGDYSPVITLDENALFFTSRRLRADSTNMDDVSPADKKYYEDIYVSYKDESGNWGQPEIMSSISVESDVHEATIGVSSDGLQLFIYKDDGGDGNIYVSKEVEGTYSLPDKLGENINTSAFEPHATLSLDGKILYFVSDMKGGLGGRDIYRVKWIDGFGWSKPKNLGAPINTPYDEDGPFIHPDGKTMYFSSNSPNSIGGFDIFFSQLIDEETDKWGDPINMGTPLNTVDDDAFFVTNASGRRGYYSSAKEGGYGEKDIYQVDMKGLIDTDLAILKGFIKMKGGERIPESTTIYVTDLTEGGDPREYKPRMRDGGYVFDLVACHKYKVEYEAEGKIFYRTNFTVPCEAGYQELDKVIMLDPLKLDSGLIVIDECDTCDTVNPLPKLRWQVLLDNVPLKQVNAFAKYVNDNNKLIAKEAIDENGEFKYIKLPNDQGYIFDLDIDDPALCARMEILLLDDKDNIIGKTIRDKNCRFTYNKFTDVDVKPASYEKYYGYNKKGDLSANTSFSKFIRDVRKIIDAKGTTDIIIEGSASKVPTSSFKSNDELAKKRSTDAKNNVLNALKRKGVDVSKVNFIAIDSRVQGPNYSDDFKNTEKYGKYQYIKIFAK
jgi:hypothetical protein